MLGESQQNCKETFVIREWCDIYKERKRQTDRPTDTKKRKYLAVDALMSNKRRKGFEYCRNYACIHTYIHTYIGLHTLIQTYIHTRTYIQYTHTYIHTYVHAYKSVMYYLILNNKKEKKKSIIIFCMALFFIRNELCAG